MHYVIIRDDDTNAFTPPECLERLYRPFLDKGLPVNLATIPAVSAEAKMADGSPEGFLVKRNGVPGRRRQQADPVPLTAAIDAAVGHSTLASETADSPKPLPSPRVGSDLHFSGVAGGKSGGLAPELARERNYFPIGENRELVAYLRANPGFRIVQHGCHHDYLEFDCANRSDVAHRLDEGTRCLQDAGFAKPDTFVAPYDRLSRPSLREVAARFRVLSTGWYELRRLPYSWWPRYSFKKLRKSPHWRVGKTLLLSHPGCLLSCHRAYSTMLGGIFHHLENQHLTVLVTHWWEYFRNNEPDVPFIEFLHETASYLATHPQLKVISFDDLVHGSVGLN